MTDALKELVERASTLQKQIDDGDGAYPSEFCELANDLMDALPALNALLSQEAELRELETKWRQISDALGAPSSEFPAIASEIATRKACADDLKALIRRHHES